MRGISQFVFSCLVLSTWTSAAQEAGCNADDCARAVTGTRLGGSHISIAMKDCSNFMQQTATVPAATVTATSAATVATSSTTSHSDTRKVPSYAAACSGASRYASACSCWGITSQIVTISSGTSTAASASIRSTTNTASTTTTLITSSSSCFATLPSGTPLLTNPVNTTSLPPFLGYVQGNASTSELTALQLTDPSSNQSVLIIPDQNGGGYLIVIESVVLSIDLSANITLLQTSPCSSSPSTVERRHHGSSFEEEAQFAQRQTKINGRQAQGSGGAIITLLVSDECGNPVTGLSPPASSSKELRLLFTCDLEPGQYLGFGFPQLAGGRLIELSPGVYNGYCEFPNGIDLSKDPLCDFGIEMVQKICDLIDPTAIPLEAEVACLPLAKAPIAYGACVLAWTISQGFCKALIALGIPLAQQTICAPPPSTVDVHISVIDFIGDGGIGDTISIQGTGGAKPVELGTYIVPDPCTPSALPTSVPGTLSCMPISYDLLAALSAGNANFGEGILNVNAGNYSADECCGKCTTNCLGFAVIDYGNCGLFIQPNPEPFRTPVPGCIEGVYPIGIPSPRPTGQLDQGNEQWYLGPCVGYF